MATAEVRTTRLLPLLALLAAVPNATVHASDVAFNAYLGIPLDGSSPFFGANCELDPVYCDRIIARWEAYANDEAEQVVCGWPRGSRLMEAAE